MTPLRQRMIEDMQLRGFSARTQECYAAAVRQLAKHYHRSPGFSSTLDSVAARGLAQQESLIGYAELSDWSICLVGSIKVRGAPA
jgi:hypothetical protein